MPCASLPTSQRKLAPRPKPMRNGHSLAWVPTRKLACSGCRVSFGPVYGPSLFSVHRERSPPFPPITCQELEEQLKGPRTATPRRNAGLQGAPRTCTRRRGGRGDGSGVKGLPQKVFGPLARAFPLHSTAQGCLVFPYWRPGSSELKVKAYNYSVRRHFLGHDFLGLEGKEKLAQLRDEFIPHKSNERSDGQKSSHGLN